MLLELRHELTFLRYTHLMYENESVTVYYIILHNIHYYVLQLYTML